MPHSRHRPSPVTGTRVPTNILTDCMSIPTQGFEGARLRGEQDDKRCTKYGLITLLLLARRGPGVRRGNNYEVTSSWVGGKRLGLVPTEVGPLSYE